MAPVEPFSGEEASERPRKRVSLGEVIRTARERAFAVLEAAARLREAAGEARAARASLLPRLGLGVSGSYLEGQQVGSFGEVRDVSFARFEPAAFLFYRLNPGGTFEEARRLREEREAAAHGVEDARRVAALQAGVAYLDVVLAHASMHVARDLVADARRFLAIVRDRARAGIASGADVARAQAELAHARQVQARARGRWESAGVRLATLLRWDPRRRIVPAEKALQPAALLDGAAEEAWEEQTAARPDLQAARARLRAAKHEEAAAWWNVLGPEVEVSFGGRLIGTDSEAFDDTTLARFLFRFSFDLAAPGRLEAARSRLEVARIRERALQQEIRGEIESARARFEAARRAVQAARRGVEAARRAHRVHLERFRAGTALGLDVIEAQNALARAKQALAEAAVERNLALLELAAARSRLEGLLDAHGVGASPDKKR